MTMMMTMTTTTKTHARTIKMITTVLSTGTMSQQDPLHEKDLVFVMVSSHEHSTLLQTALISL
jgi:hypothetical protein